MTIFGISNGWIELKYAQMGSNTSPERDILLFYHSLCCLLEAGIGTVYQK